MVLRASKTPENGDPASNHPSNPKTGVLLFKIDPADSAGAGRGPEIISKEYTSYGSYSARIKIPDVTKVQPNVGAVVGYFTYNMDSSKGLSEIDIEWLIADPHIIYIGTWTGTHGKLQRIGRVIDLSKGEISSTISKVGYTGTPTTLTGPQNQPETISAIPGYNAAERFYTYRLRLVPRPPPLVDPQSRNRPKTNLMGLHRLNPGHPPAQNKIPDELLAYQ